jgi:hypothetical protein
MSSFETYHDDFLAQYRARQKATRQEMIRRRKLFERRLAWRRFWREVMEPEFMFLMVSTAGVCMIAGTMIVNG